MYNPSETEKKRQKIWGTRNAHKFDPSSEKPKYYILAMFPYPSGRIHMGHVRNYVIGDVFARYYRLRGCEVFHPIGWDSFGLPAENAAIKNKIPPGDWTESNIVHMKSQLMRLGVSYDWSAEIATSRKDYYRWNQWFFLKMLERGLAYRKKSAVNWCPKCATVLANEQTAGGRCWRCSSTVETKELEQWFIKITDYAERLLDGHRLLDGKWPQEVLAMQKYWLGRSEGAEVDFEINGEKEILKIFTTRPDTLYGATFMVLAPEHPLTARWSSGDKKIAAYAADSTARRANARAIGDADDRTQKTGVFSGRYAINPADGRKIPVWISDYVTMDYGTGAIMCVPAHDRRDFEFARKFGIEIRPVIKPRDSNLPDPLEDAYEGGGVMINSGEGDGLDNADFARRITEELEKKGKASKAAHWRLKDWLISRQRYWGTPIPVVYCEKCGVRGVDEKDLPVELPRDVRITGEGSSPLASHEKFVRTRCPSCGGPAERETDTMDTFVDSSWYYARYCDPRNDAAPFDKRKAARLIPVDQYVGGIEHACMHLIYSRFWHKFMKDIGLVESEEPFARLLTQGMVTLGGETMSKSKGNIVEPDEIINEYGADALRVFIMFAAPPEGRLDWSNSGLEGVRRFLNRIARLVEKSGETPPAETPAENRREAEALEKLAAKTAAKAASDIETEQQFNTAVAAMMEMLNALCDYPRSDDAVFRRSLETLLTILLPFAPHFAEEMLEKLGQKNPAWPVYDSALLVENEKEIPVQINGRTRGKVLVREGESRDEVLLKIKAEKSCSAHIAGKNIKKYIYVPGKIANLVTD